MAKENDNDIEIPEEENLGELGEDTDWKGKAGELQRKHREAGIRNRERTKALRDKIAELETAKAAAVPDKKEPKPDEFGLTQKAYLRAAGITEEDEVELAKDVQKKIGLDWDKLVDDDYFKAKLEGLRTAKANAAATANIKGDKTGTPAKDTPEYWAAKIATGDVANLPSDPELVSKAAFLAADQHKGKTKVFYDD